MKSKTIYYQDGEQKLIGELFLAEEASATIVLFPAFEGRSKFLLDYAYKLTQYGFNTFAADIYGDAQTAATIEGCFDLVMPFIEDRALVRRRSCLVVETVRELRLTSQLGVMGFCFGGMCALEVARAGIDIDRVAVLHGVLAKSALPTEMIKAKLLFLQGYQDPQVPPSQLTDIANELQQAENNDWTFTFFGDAKHSFTDPLTGTFSPDKEKEMGREYNKIIAEQAFRYVLDFMQY